MAERRASKEINKKRTAVKLKASDYVGLPKKKKRTGVKLKASDYVGLPKKDSSKA